MSDDILQTLSDSLPKGSEVQFIDKKHLIGKLQLKAAIIRLLHQNGYNDIQPIIDWENSKSPDKLPAKALGMDPVALIFLKWAIKNERRYKTFIQSPIIALVSSFMLDYLPALFCGCHFFIYQSNKNWFEGGRAMQRFWLTAAQQQLCMHPSYSHIALGDFFDQPYELTRAIS